ncbi:unnamed protein product [Zymoseptoria tritici ST99CH_3D7]|uniref:Uncharacterized protein n=1 Tax=Zymoseptoria tritici (strain ST99CH_3D7) TaxID=1276538 RepID=A0A1X7S5Q9_ZYMT9|nr:unnamed protein product [Zymoseptoria tritici ST99CH_3D7]
MHGLHTSDNLGIAWEVKDDKTVYSVWSEWYPTGGIDFPDFQLSQGDLIRARVVAHGTNSGTAYITNESTGQTASRTFTNRPALCLTSAEWIIEDDAGFSTKPFANFGQVVFDETKYTTDGAPGTLEGATIADMRQDEVLLTDCRIPDEEDYVACSYVGP